MGKHFDLSRYGDTVSVKSFELEILAGRDSLDATARSIAPMPADGTPPTPTHPLVFGVLHRNQLIAQSISKVNGQLVERPFIAWQDWSLRTQEFVVAAYQRLNEAKKSELDDFLGASFGTPQRPNDASAQG